MALQIIDLTLRLNDETVIYRDGDFSDPPFRVEDWCDIADRGFRVSKLEMGTQTGTHIDAPVHFLEGGATLEMIDLDRLIGPYFLVEVDEIENAEQRSQLLARYDGQQILVIRGNNPTAQLSMTVIRDLLALGCPVWVFATDIAIRNEPPLLINRMIARDNVALIEGINHPAALNIRPGGQMLALPLRLEGVSGSPCRVVVLQDSGHSE